MITATVTLHRKIGNALEERPLAKETAIIRLEIGTNGTLYVRGYFPRTHVRHKPTHYVMWVNNMPYLCMGLDANGVGDLQAFVFEWSIDRKWPSEFGVNVLEDALRDAQSLPPVPPES